MWKVYLESCLLFELVCFLLLFSQVPSANQLIYIAYIDYVALSHQSACTIYPPPLCTASSNPSSSQAWPLTSPPHVQLPFLFLLAILAVTIDVEVLGAKLGLAKQSFAFDRRRSRRG